MDREIEESSAGWMVFAILIAIAIPLAGWALWALGKMGGESTASRAAGITATVTFVLTFFFYMFLMAAA